MVQDGLTGCCSVEGTEMTVVDVPDTAGRVDAAGFQQWE